MVVHVELHQCDDAAEFRHKTAHHARFIHAAQGTLRISVRTEYFQKQTIGFGIIAQIVPDKIQFAGHRTQRCRMHIHTFGIRDMEQPDEVHGVFAKQT